MAYEWLMPGREPLPFLPLWQGSRPGITGFPSAEMRAASRFRGALIAAAGPDVLDGGDAHHTKVSVPFDARAREPLAIPQADAYTASGGGGHRLTVIPELDVFATVTA
jgi:hypothetical protein